VLLSKVNGTSYSFLRLVVEVYISLRNYD